MRDKYVCKFGLYHHKKVDAELNPSSNNGWIYTAYADMLGFDVDGELIVNAFKQCQDNEGGYIRLPNKFEPPMSRDEIIGMYSLGLITEILPNWRFHKPHLKVSLWKQLKAVWSLKGEHRNYVWENKIYDAYPIVFKLFWHDRFYVKTLLGINPTWFERVAFNTHVNNTVKNGSAGEKNLLKLQIYDTEYKLTYSQENDLYKGNTLLEYFGKDHIFNA